MLHYQQYTCPMDTEVFKRSKKYPRYLVSNYGTIKNSETGHIMTHHINSAGYELVQLTIHQKNHHVQVHRLVAYTFMKNPSAKKMPIVNHLDENPHNNRLDNLEFCDREWNANWGTVRERVQDTRKHKKQLVGVCVISKQSKKVYRFDTIKDASLFSGKEETIIRDAIRDWHKKIEGPYVFCLPQEYGEKYAEKLINNSLGYHYQKYYNIYAINIFNRHVLQFNSLKQAGRVLHMRTSPIEELLNNPHAANPTDYVFCTRDNYDKFYIDFLINCYTPKQRQAIPIVGMNINTGEIQHFKSIKQAEHQLNNQSVQPYLLGKVRSAKNWVFCKEHEYSKKLLQQKAREAKPNNNFEIVILNCKTGQAIRTTSDIKSLSNRCGVAVTTILNQLNHNAVSITGQQFIYADKFNEQVKQNFISLYNRVGRGHAVYAINVDSYQITKFKSLQEASNSLEITKDRIQSVLTGESNQSHGYAFCREQYYSKFRMYLLAYTGKWGKEGFPVSSVDKQGKQTFYESVKDAANKLNLNKNNIFRVVRGERKTYKGYSWFKEDRDKYIRSLVK